MHLVLPSDVLKRTVGKKAFPCSFCSKTGLALHIYNQTKGQWAGLMVQSAQSICILSHKFHIKQNVDKEKHSLSILP